MMLHHKRTRNLGRRLLIVSLLQLATLQMETSLQAAPIAQTRVDLNALVLDPSSIVNFGESPQATPVNGLTIKGYTFSESTSNMSVSFGPGITNSVNDPSIFGFVSSGYVLTVTMPGLATDFGFGYAIDSNLTTASALTITLFNGLTLLGSQTYGAAPDPNFIGGYAAIKDSSGFTSAEISFNPAFNTRPFVIDNLVAVVTNNAPISAVQTGLPLANVQGQMLINAGSTVTNDLNGHLFNLQAGDGEEDANDSIAALMDEGVVVGQGDGQPDAKNPIAKRVPRSRQWEIFTTVNYGNVKLNAINNQAGVQIDAWAPSIGIERHLSRGLAVGFAATFLTSDQNYTNGLGRLHLEGPALSAYVSFARKNFWSSLLYSFGTYELDSRRNPGFGFAQAFGTTQTYTNSVQYNTGWNFRFQNNTLVTGPFVGVDYLHGTVDAYSETGGGLAALTFARQTYQSLVARVGWSATKKVQTSWAAITPQVRLSYERQNLENNGSSVSLINAPFTAAGGNQTPGQSYLVAGAGVNFQFNDQFSLLLSYQGQFLRDNMQAHFGSVRLGYKF